MRRMRASGGSPGPGADGLTRRLPRLPGLCRRVGVPSRLLSSALWAAALGLAACGGGDPPAAEASTRYARPTGSLQCEPSQSTESQRQRVVDQLKAAAVVVLSSSCANDNALRIQVCGAANGDLFVVDVATSTPLTALRAAGFSPWAEWPQATLKTCPPG